MSINATLLEEDKTFDREIFRLWEEEEKKRLDNMKKLKLEKEKKLRLEEDKRLELSDIARTQENVQEPDSWSGSEDDSGDDSCPDFWSEKEPKNGEYGILHPRKRTKRTLYVPGEYDCYGKNG